MAYERINWQNEPSEATALSDVNFNKMDSAIYEHDQTLPTKVDKVEGKGLSTNDYTDTDKTKLDNIHQYATNYIFVPANTSSGKLIGHLQRRISPTQTQNYASVYIASPDSALSSSSTNYIQNKVVKSALDNKVDKEDGKGLSQVDNVSISSTTSAGTKIGEITVSGVGGSAVGTNLYNGVTVDSALSNESENPVQNKVVKEELDKKLDGTSAKELNVRSAMMLLTPPITNNAPYVKRIVGGGIQNPYLCKLKKLIGASVVWNQLVKNGNFVDTSNWSVANASNASLSIANNVATVTFLGSGSGYSYGIKQSIGVLNCGHKYLLLCDFNCSVTGTYGVDCNNTSIGKRITVSSAYTWTSLSIIFSADTNTADIMYIQPISSITANDTMKVRNVNLIDITQVFNTTIADYVYTLETAQAGSGIAWLKSYGFFTEDYYAYSANTMQSVSVSAKINKDSEDTTISTVALDHTTLRGLFKLDANNNLYADGDEYLPSGGENVNYAEADLGSLDYTYIAGGLYFNADLPTPQKRPATTATVANAISDSGLENVAANYIAYSSSKDLCYAFSSSTDKILIRDMACTTKEQMQTKYSGKKVIYEIATPTTATLAPYTSLQNIESGGTEEFIDYGVEQGTRDVAIPCGQESEYNSGMGIPNLPTSGGKVALNYNPADGKFSWE